METQSQKGTSSPSMNVKHAGQGQQSSVQYVPVPVMQSQPQQRGQQLNNLYKTALCKHFTQFKHCVKGNGCHFAHGELELRRKDEQLPIEVQYKMLNIPYNNYKTQVCKYFEQEKQCHFGKNCTYAHGRDELRKPYEELPCEMNVGIEVTNPNAFRLLKAQVEALQPRFILNYNDQDVKNHILDISNIFRQNYDEKALNLVQTMLQNKQISTQYTANPSGQQQQTQQFANASPLSNNGINIQQLQHANLVTTPGVNSSNVLSSIQQQSQPNQMVPGNLPFTQGNFGQATGTGKIGKQVLSSSILTSGSSLGQQQQQNNVNLTAAMLTQQYQQQQQLMELTAQNPQLMAAAMNQIIQQNQFNLLNQNSQAVAGGLQQMNPQAIVTSQQQQNVAQNMQFQQQFGGAGVSTPQQYSLVGQPVQQQQLQLQRQLSATQEPQEQNFAASIFVGQNNNQRNSSTSPGLQQHHIYQQHQQHLNNNQVYNGNTFGQGFLYTALPGESSVADNAQWSMQSQQ